MIKVYPKHLLLALALLWGAAGAASAATLTGTVRDEAGDPIAGAAVWVTQNRQVNKSTTSSDGRFKAAGLEVALTEVVAYKDGYALGGSAAPFHRDQDITIVLRPADIISLKVINIDSAPVAGVKVRSMLIERRTLVSVDDLEPHGFPTIRSTDAGILVIPNLPPEGFIQLALQHPDYADSSIRYLPVDDEQRNIVMERGGRANGRITFDGRGLENARVSIFKVGPRGQKEFAEVLTDREGFYSARIAPGEYQVAAQHPEYASPPPAALVVRSLEDSEPTSLEMLEPHFVTGKVLLPDKSPCPGAGVQYRLGSTIYENAVTGSDGVFRLRVPGGKGAITIQPPPGYMTPNFGPIGVDPGDLRKIDLSPVVLERLPVITGTVRDSDGREPGVTLVTALNLPVPLSIITDVPVPFSILTDAKGDFELPLTFMPPVEELNFRAEHPLRFQRADFSVKIKNPKPASVKLSQFTPDLERRPPAPGANNLAGLLDQPAPVLSGDKWIRGDAVSLADLKGKVVVLLFWAGFDESIGPIMLRELHVLHELLKGVEDVAFISVHDAISSAEEIEEYIDYFNIPYPVLRDSDEQTTFSTYGIVFIPQVVLIDKKGALRYFQTEGRLLELIKGLRRE